jgi:hypothetical protein
MIKYSRSMLPPSNTIAVINDSSDTVRDANQNIVSLSSP